MPNTRKYKQLRREVAAKKALAEVEGTEAVTMKSDAIHATEMAEHKIEAFLDGGGGTAALERALHALREGRDGAIGDADLFFRKAIEELETVVEDDG